MKPRGILFAVYASYTSVRNFLSGYTGSFLHVSAFILVTYGIDIYLLHFSIVWRSLMLNLKFFSGSWLSVLFLFRIFHRREYQRSAPRSGEQPEKTSGTLEKINAKTAIHDDLTGFFNRCYLMGSLEAEKQSFQTCSGSVSSLAMTGSP